MKLKFALIASIALITTPVFAQGTPSVAYVPWTMSQGDYEALQKFLVDKPYSFSAPIMGFLAQHEQAALDAAQKSVDKKPVDSKGKK